MVGAGMIKIRVDECGETALHFYYHFETQPIPASEQVVSFLPRMILKDGILV